MQYNELLFILCFSKLNYTYVGLYRELSVIRYVMHVQLQARIAIVDITGAMENDIIYVFDLLMHMVVRWWIQTIMEDEHNEKTKSVRVLYVAMTTIIPCQNHNSISEHVTEHWSSFAEITDVLTRTKNRTIPGVEETLPGTCVWSECGPIQGVELPPRVSVCRGAVVSFRNRVKSDTPPPRQEGHVCEARVAD